MDTVSLALLGFILLVPLLRFITRIKFGDFEAELVDRAKLKASAGLIAIKEVITETDGTSASASGASTSSGRAQALDSAQEKREIIAHYMAVPAEWGWNMAHAGFKEPPEPVLEWDAEGYPLILYGQSQTWSRDALRRAAGRRREHLRSEREASGEGE